MTFKEIKTPEQLMKYLDQNFKYGVIDKKGNKYYNSNTAEFQRICETQWELRPVEAMLKDGVGHCYDQVEIEREWFSKNGYNVKNILDFCLSRRNSKLGFLPHIFDVSR